MQLPVYVATADYETLGKGKPQEFKTVPQWISRIIADKAEFIRTTTSASGEPVIPQHERV